MATPRKPIKKIADDLAKMAAQLVADRLRPLIQSETLKRSMYVMKEKRSGSYRIVFPYYWAIYYHNGRDTVEAAPGHYLIYFRDPRNDPRLRGGYPKNKKDVKKLSSAQFRFGLKMNRKLQKAGGGPMDYMVLAKSVGPARPHPFIKEALGRFPVKILRQVAIKFHQTVQSIIPSGKKVIRVRWG